MSHHEIYDLASYERLLAEHASVVLFKHSPICPVSAEALHEWETFRAGRSALTTAQVDVIAERPVSRAIAAASGVVHQSPQAILFVHGRAVWHASHDAITVRTLTAACEQHGVAP